MRSVFSDQEVGRLLQRYLDGEIDELRAALTLTERLPVLVTAA
jgi:hypothetical protein